MSDTTPRLALAQLVSAQEMNVVTWNEALAQLDALVDLYLLGQGTNTPPASPSDGDAYIVGNSPTGAWSGYSGKIASCLDGAWRFYTPFNGLRAYVATTGAFIVYVNGAWTDCASLIPASEAAVASASTCDLGAAGSLFVQITGTTTITSFGTGANKLRLVRFAGSLTLTHNAASLIIPGGASLTTAAGDTCIASSDGSGNWRVRHYQPAGFALWGQPEATLSSASTVDLGSVNAHKVQITGATAITSFGTKANAIKFVRFAGALTLTHNAGSLILLGGASRTTAAGDCGIYESDASGNWRERSYFRAASDPGDYATKSGTETLANKTLSSPTVAGLLSLLGASGGQIAFPAAQNPSSDPNTLDDYEEGTWTPTLGCTTTDPTGVSYSVQAGYYTKIGNAVVVSFGMGFSNKGTGGSGGVLTRGLPFTIKNPSYTTFAPRCSNITFSTGYSWMAGYASAGTTYAGFQQCGSGLGMAAVDWAANFANNSAIYSGATYLT